MNVSIVLMLPVLFISCTVCAEINTKCSINDGACLKDFYQNLLIKIAENGIPSLNIPPIDPFPIENLSVPLLGSIVLTINGVVKGMKRCILTQYALNLEEKTGKLGIVCDVAILGHFNFSGSSDITKQLFNVKEVAGEGDEKVKLEKLRLNVTFSVYPIVRDGVTYLHQPSSGVDYTYSADNFKVATEHFLIGNNDISKLVDVYVNENWKFLFKLFGKTFIDQALMIYLNYIENFYKETPASNFIIEDLSPFVVKE